MHKTNDNKDKYLVAAFVSHPIHYIINLFKSVEKELPVKLEVLFGSDFSIKEGRDTTFGKVVRWYTPEILDGLSHKFLNNISPYKNVGKFFSLINLGIFKELKSNRYDAIFIHGWNYFSNWIAILSAIVTKTPIILRGESPLIHNSKRSRARLIIKYIVLKLMFRFVSAFLYIGKENKKFYLHYGVPEKKLFFAPYAVDNDYFLNKSKELKKISKSELKKRVGINNNPRTILFLGKLTGQKRPFDLLKAYETAVNDDSKIAGNNHLPTALIFVGDGPLRPMLEDYAKNHNLSNVHFAGFKGQAELPAYYALSDVFVLPSGAGETWGLVVNEAMCFGLPVIVSDLVGCGSDLVQNGKNGYIFPAGDISALSAVLKKFIEDKDAAFHMGKESEKIISRYGFDEDGRGLMEALKYLSQNENL